MLKAGESARSQAEPGKRCEATGRILPLFVGGEREGGSRPRAYSWVSWVKKSFTKVTSNNCKRF